MAERDVVIRIAAKNLSKEAFDAARKQLDDLGKKAGLTNAGFGQMGKGFQKAAQDLANFNPTAARATSLLSGFGAAGLVAGAGIGVGIAALGAISAVVGKATQEALKYADALDNQSKQTLVGVEALQIWNEAAKIAGISSEAITGAAQRLQKSLGEGADQTRKAITDLGLDFQSLRQLKPEDQFETIASALGHIKDPAEQARIETDLFGKAGSNLRALWGSTLPDLEEQMRSLGLVISADVIANVDQLGDNLGMLSRTAEGTWVAFGAGIAQSDGVRMAVLGATEALGFLNTALLDSDGSFQSWTDFIATAGMGTIQGLGEAWLEFAGIVLKVGAVVEASKTSPIEALKQWATGEETVLASLKGDLQNIDLAVGSMTRKWAKQFDDLKKKAFEPPKLGITPSGGGFVDELTAAQKKAAEEAKKAAEAMLRFTGQMVDDWEQARREAFAIKNIFGAGAFASISSGFDDIVNMGGTRFPGMTLDVPGIAPPDFGLLEDSAANLGLSLEQASQLSQIFGDSLGVFGQALLQGAASGQLLDDAFEDIGENGLNLANAMSAAIGIMAGIKAIGNATAHGSRGSRAAKGAIAGAEMGMAAGPIGAGIGAAVGALVGWFRGKGPADVGRDAGRDIGVELSQALMEEIDKSGEPIQTFLTEIFEEGGLGIDRMAEEVGDLFSMFERGEISKDSLLGELKEDLPILIEHFQELGPEGQEQIERIIQAAKDAGVSIEELGQIIALTLDDDEVLAIVDQLGVTDAAAKALGITIDQLGEKVKSIFAPETLETLAENFGKTTEEMRQILADLGINVQTDLERLAAEAGLSVKDFEALGAALEEAAGIPAEKLSEFLKETGQTAEELAASLGVDVTASTGSVAEGAAAANAELERGVELSGMLAENLGRAAAAAGGIHIPDFDTGGGVPATGAQHGFHGDVVGPRMFLVEPGVRERVDIGPQGSSGKMNITFAPTINLPPGTPEAHARILIEALEKNISGLKTRTQSILGIPTT